MLENLEVWKRACRLCVNTCKITHGCRDFAFKGQITRAALSIPSNIAEGYERNFQKDYIRFLRIAKGSCGELRTQLWIATRLDFIPHEESTMLVNETIELSRMLQGLINYCQGNRKQNRPARS